MSKIVHTDEFIAYLRSPRQDIDVDEYENLVMHQWYEYHVLLRIIGSPTESCMCVAFTADVAMDWLNGIESSFEDDSPHVVPLGLCNATAKKLSMKGNGRVLLEDLTPGSDKLSTCLLDMYESTEGRKIMRKSKRSIMENGLKEMDIPNYMYEMKRPQVALLRTAMYFRTRMGADEVHTGIIPALLLRLWLCKHPVKVIRETAIEAERGVVLDGENSLVWRKSYE